MKIILLFVHISLCIIIPKVSVILPSYNVKKYIHQCLESARNQTLKQLEFIIVDCGSNDGTLSVINDFVSSDSRFRLINSEIKSYGYQMNLGIKAARGQYIGIIETDDFVDSNMYQKLYDLAQTHNFPDVVKSEFNYVKKNNTEITKSSIYTNTYNSVFNFKQYPYLILEHPSLWSGIYRRDFLNTNNIEFLESPGASFQDTGFYLKIFYLASTVFTTPLTFYYYRTDNPGSSVHNKQKVFAIVNEFKAFELFIDRFPELKRYWRKYYLAKKTRSYCWNYERISKQFRDAFIKRIRNEFTYDMVYEAKSILPKRHLKFLRRVLSTKRKSANFIFATLLYLFIVLFCFSLLFNLSSYRIRF